MEMTDRRIALLAALPALNMLALRAASGSIAGRISIGLALVSILCCVAGLFAPPSPTKAQIETLINALRQEGLYPPAGTGTDEDVKSLLQAGHHVPALRLYTEVHPNLPVKERMRHFKQLNRS